MQKNKVFLILTVLIFMAAAAGISAQSMQVIDDLLAADQALFGDSVYMVAVGSGIADESVSTAKAVEIISDKGWNVENKKGDSPITLGELSFITMQAFDLEGGIMYMLMPSARYAVRELAFEGVISVEAHPGNAVKGDEVLRIISGAVDLKEAE